MNKGKDVTHWGLENREWQELIHPSCKELSLRGEVWLRGFLCKIGSRNDKL